MRVPNRVLGAALVAMIAIVTSTSDAQTPASTPGAAPKYTPDVPAKITTPDTVETRIGTLRFKDGAPDPATVQLAYDQIDFNRGVDAFVKGMSATSVYAALSGPGRSGRQAQRRHRHHRAADGRSLAVPDANTTTVYVLMCVNLKDGPMVVRVPPRALGPVDDANFRWVTDVGLTGADKGAGGDYLFVPPGYKGRPPREGLSRRKAEYQPAPHPRSSLRRKGRSRRGGGRCQGQGGDVPVVAGPNPPATSFVNLSGVKFNTISANDFSFYEELDAVVQNEPADWVDPDTVGLYAAIGIRKGKPFAPDARMKKMLTESVAVATPRPREPIRIARSRNPDLQGPAMAHAVRGRQLPVPRRRRAAARRESDVLLLRDGHHAGMTNAKPGTGSAYAVAFRDSARQLPRWRSYLQGDPARPRSREGFWAFTVYDNQTRSLLPTDQKPAGLDSTLPGLKRNADGGATVWFGPKAPAGNEAELGANDARTRVQRASAALWAARTVVQPDLAAGRPRNGELGIA